DLHDVLPVVGVHRGVEVELGEGREQAVTYRLGGGAVLDREDVEVGRAAPEVRHALDAGDHRLAATGEVDHHAGHGELLEAARGAQADRVAHREAVPVVHRVRDQDSVAAGQTGVTAHVVALPGHVLE